MKKGFPRPGAWLFTLMSLCFLAQDIEAAPIDVQRQQALIRLVRQDCGSCHGLTLQGGLGPPLTTAALHERSQELLSGVILLGRPGTPMPPFAGIVNEAEARWIAQRLLAGFPQE